LILCRQSLASQGRNPGVLLWMGRALGQLWCYAEAQRCLRQAARLSSHLPKVQAALRREQGDLYLSQGHFGKAQVCYQEAVQADRASCRPWLSLGVCQALQGQLAEARLSLAQGLRRRQEMSWENHYWMGYVLRAQEHFEEAAPYLARGSQSQAEDCRRVGQARVHDSGPACQLMWARKQAREHPQDASAYTLQASSLSEMGRLRPALGALRKAWRLVPLETYKWSSLALIYANCGRYARAADCYLRAQPNQYPGNWLIRSGLYRARAGQRAAAEECLQRGLAMETTYRDQGHLVLGLLYCGSNRLEEAEEHFRKSLDCNPDNEEAYQALTDVHLAMAASLG
jgi:tetratricopeptide (TPR) repeat protein